MATSEDRENRDASPPESDKTRKEKPKSSPVRRIGLLLLLVATIIVVGLEYLPEGESETVVGPAAKKLSPAQRPAQPRHQKPATPQQPAQPKTPAPTPPQYERPPETIFVSSSPSDQVVLAGGPSESVTETGRSPMAVPSELPPPSEEAPVLTGTATAATVAPAANSPPAASESPTTSEPAKADATGTPATPAESVLEDAAIAATTAPAPATPVALSVQPAPIAVASSPELVASRSPAPSALPGEDHTVPAIMVDPSVSLPQAIARPMPEGPVPPKINRYARRLLKRYDTNGDGMIDATEQRQMQGDPTAADYDADGLISIDELAAYAADFGRHRRMRLTGTMVEEAVAELPSLYIPTAEREAMAAAQAAAQQAAQQAQVVPVALADEAGGPDAELTEGVSADEKTAETEPAQPAANQVSSKRFVMPKSRLAGLPDWFLANDRNGDGQLTMAEYAPNSEKARLADFARQDRNKDGVLTAQECPKKKR